VAQARPLLRPPICHPLNDLRFWGREFKYDEHVACVRKGGITLRKGKNAPKGTNPVASTSMQLEEEELLDDEWDEEADEDVVQDELAQSESFNADWSRDFVCVADPFIVGKVGLLPSLR